MNHPKKAIGNSEETTAVVPLPERIIQEVERVTLHGVDRLTQQPVFTLKSKEKQVSIGKTTNDQLANAFHANLDKPFQVCQSSRLEGL